MLITTYVRAPHIRIMLLNIAHLRVWASRIVVLDVRAWSVEAEQAVLQGHELQVLVEDLRDHVYAALRQGFPR